MSEVQLNYKEIEEQIDKYLYEYNIVALLDTVAYVLNLYRIYLNVKPRDVILAYRDYMSIGVFLTIVLKTGVAIKVKISTDKNREKVTGVEVWYITE